MKLDEKDLMILDLLQQDANISNKEIADALKRLRYAVGDELCEKDGEKSFHCRFIVYWIIVSKIKPSQTVHLLTRYTIERYVMPPLVERPISQVRLLE